ncbi:MAG: hypothetical protein SPL82_08610, partial [Lachnospiraceae bacterium]|nr:hypothetical protein [Lachnospiraceae bacterium]
MNMKITQLYDYSKKKVEENRELYISYLKNAISCNTTNPPGNEDVLARYIQEILMEHGIESVLQQVYPNRSNVIGVYTFGTGGKKLLLNAHMDVVAPGDVLWKFSDRPALAERPDVRVADGEQMVGRNRA